MNFQIHQILSQPALLKEVPNELLQNWIVQYPYVSLFHLYHLKSKGKYNEADLHKTAFYFNNREKLYQLLNNIPFESTVTTTQKTKENNLVFEEPQIIKENKNDIIEISEDVNSLQLSTAQLEEVQDLSTEEASDDVIQKIQEADNKTEYTTASATEEIITNISKQEVPLNTEEQTFSENTAVLTTDSEIENNIIEEKKITEIIPEAKPLSIADQILLEIQQIKEERAKKALNIPETEKSESIEISLHQPEITERSETNTAREESIETQDVVPVTEVDQENINNEKSSALTDTKETEKSKFDSGTEIKEKNQEQINVLSKHDEEVLAKVQLIKEEREKQLQEFTASRHFTPEITIDETILNSEHKINPEIIGTTEENIEVPEKILSIQDEIIARIQKIKEERAKQLEEQAIQETSKPEIQENNKETLLTNNEDKLETTNTETIPVAEQTDTNNLEEITSIQSEQSTENKLSIQDEIIERIRRIQEERKLKAEEVNKELPIIEDSTVTNEDHIIKTTNIDDEEKGISNDIIIIEKSERPLAEVDNNDDKNPLEEILLISSTEAIDKDIELLESKLLTEIEQEKTDVDVLSSIHQPAPEIEKSNELSNDDVQIKTISTDDTSDAELGQKHPVQVENIQTNISETEEMLMEKFESIFPKPLLVKVELSEILNKELPVTVNETRETSVESAIEPSLDAQKIITEDKNNNSEENQHPEEQLIIPEEYPDEAIEHMSIISKTSDLYIPEVKEDELETVSENEIISDKQIETKPSFHEPSIDDEIIPPVISEEIIHEPHTFVEWLKILDGNLQIQTADTVKEVDNWIEIPRYEIEQAIANKKDIEKEEQKLFEPNFEEGEVDLFNEIDEEVTKVASESVQFRQDMMTETLAKIYVKQGKNDKALEIYNTLLLKFPEKSAYFAALIEKIEKE